MMSYMMMSEMFKGNNTNNSNMSSMLPFMLMGGGNITNMFDGIFDFEQDEETTDEETEEDE